MGNFGKSFLDQEAIEYYFNGNNILHFVFELTYVKIIDTVLNKKMIMATMTKLKMMSIISTFPTKGVLPSARVNTRNGTIEFCKLNAHTVYL